MKKFVYLGFTLVMVSCGMEEVDLYDQNLIDKEAAYANADKIFGSIDPNQDWNCIVSGSVTVTADASLMDIVKVQILTESPFMNDQAAVLAEATVSKGDMVTLKYDAPQDLKRLIAACVDGQGNYFIKGFNIGETSISFKKNSTTRSFTRAAAGLPDMTSVELDFSNSFLSFNAGRALSDNTDYIAWKNKHWENDRLWLPTGPASLGSNWKMDRSTIFTDATPLDDADKATLQDIFNTSLFRDDSNNTRGRKDNLSLIREGSAVKFFNNHLVSNGQAPLTLIPVQLASTEAQMCDIYYYYYKVGDVPTGMSETDYIKQLPKFKAIDLNLERLAFKAKTGISETQRDENFLRIHEYLLPYYGDALEFVPEKQMLSNLGYTTDGTFYRIRNFSDGKDHYITSNDVFNTLKDSYTESIEDQLWQIFTNNKEGRVMFYNVGTKKFLWCNNSYPEVKDITDKSLLKYTFYISDGDQKPIGYEDITKRKVYILTYNKNNCLKSVEGKHLGMGQKSKNGYREWTFEKYTASLANAITEFELPIDYYPLSVNSTHANASAIIPDGYRVGFMIRKDNGATKYNDARLANDKCGCMYGCGELNKEINTFGQFKSSVTDYVMNVDDPRMATFNANGKTYLCFEEGADTQYSDVIIEVGGVSDTQVKKALAQEADNVNLLAIYENEGAEARSGVYLLNDYMVEDRTLPMAYTMCFEDRPNTADYDMNDVVIRCIRRDDTTLQLSLVAAGANDTVYIRGAKGWMYNNMEIHEIFCATEPDAKGNRFVNTEKNSVHLDSMAAFIKVASTVSIPEYLSNIYIENKTTGKTVGLSQKGEPPYAIIVPQEFCYPMEKTPVTSVYKTFLNWAKDVNSSKDWYLNADPDKFFPSLFKKW